MQGHTDDRPHATDGTARSDTVNTTVPTTVFSSKSARVPAQLDADPLDTARTRYLQAQADRLTSGGIGAVPSESLTQQSDLRGDRHEML